MHLSAPTDDAASLAAKIVAAVSANMWATASDEGVISDFDILALDGSSSTVNFVTGGGSTWAGQETGDPIMNAPAIIKLATGLRGPRHRGRVFIPYTAEDIQHSGIILETTAGLTTAAWEDFANALVADDVALGVASYAHSDWNQVLNLKCERALGTMRRRQDAVRRSTP